MNLSDRTTYTLRRLHSLSGVLPIGVFLGVHLFTNSKSVHGPIAFNRAAEEIARLPYVVLLEVFGIALPILFHIVLGILIAATARANVFGYGTARNWMYLLQRVSGVFLVFFIVAHVWTTRLAPDAGADLFGLMERHLSHPGVFAFYLLGVVTAAFHLGNGLFGFAIHWGIATGRRAQTWAARIGFAVALVVALVGINALLGFRGNPVRLFERGDDVHTARAGETG
jgi:succinate dehydrogenase / fumarate reductase, cytochrome b subunit